jgi:aminopeptidase N
MFKLILLSLQAFLVVGIAQAQFLKPGYTDEMEDLYEHEALRYQQMRDAGATATADSNIDVTYYKLDLTITTSPNYLQGIVTVKSLSRVVDLSTITLDLVSTMTVDSVKMGNTRLNFVQYPTTVSINLDRSYGYGEMVVLNVYYRGTPVSTGYGSFEFGAHAGTPWVWTLSEPYGASDWWPCKDHPLDKADSTDIWITCNSAFKVGSNGKLVAVIDNGNGTKTHQWEERYPISTYLVSIALTNFAEFSNWFRYSPTDSMQVLNYVLPEQLSVALDSLPQTVEVLRIFSNLFGMYPFIQEKYGHSQMGRGGAMEHQTMTSTTSFSEYLIVHELAHQWFGDLITCANWSNLWLNEGFAKYSEGLYTEVKNGSAAYNAFMAGQADAAKNAVGPVHARDTVNLQELFDRPRVYNKGAMVLHMLRHVLGDSVFFQALRSYVNDPRFRFNVATTEGFQSVCESVSGKELSYFFNEWIYGEKFPRYAYEWSAKASGLAYEVTIQISQVTGTTNPAFFTMPIDFKVSTSGWDTTVVLFNSSNDQTFSFTVPHEPTSVALDPNMWILRDIEESLIPTRYTLEQNYPNPFNSTTTIVFSIPPVGIRQDVSLRVYDLLGQEIAVLVKGVFLPGTYRATLDASGLASSVYYYRLKAGEFSGTRKLLLLK